MSVEVNENGDRLWWGNHMEVGEVVYEKCSPARIGKIIEVDYEHLPHLDEYAEKGKKTVEQMIKVRWLKKGTIKAKGAEETWERAHLMWQLENLVEDHERKAKKQREDLEKAKAL